MDSNKQPNEKMNDAQDLTAYLGKQRAIVNISQMIKKATSNNNNNDNNNDVEDDPPEQYSAGEASLLQKIIRKGLVENDCDLEIERRDPSSPLHYVNTFQALNLPERLLRGVYEMGFNAPSRIQETALPCLLAHPPQNLIAQSQSGTGKTAAFILAMLMKVNTSLNYPQVLCLSPTYELAIQTGEVTAKMSTYCPEIKIKYAVRGEVIPKGTQVTDHIIIGTPGKALDWTLKQKAFDVCKLSVFVLDEADVMIATQGHKEQCIRIHRHLSPSCQMMFFSATYGEDIMHFAEVIVPRPLIIRLRREEQCLKNIKQYYVKCSDSMEKYMAVTNIYSVLGIGQCIIFCHTRKKAHWLASKMHEDGHAVAVLTAELSVQDRLAVLDQFRESRERLLITTNVLSRGIDIERVTIVVNFDLPITPEDKADCETYLHRIGRSGRFGKQGIAISLVDSERAMQVCRDIEEYFQVKITYLNTEDCDEIEKLQQ